MNAICFACLSHEGKTHDANEDRWYADPEQGLFLVSDGMANDIAPQIVIELLPSQLREILSAANELHDPALHQQVRDTLHHLSRQVRAAMEERFELGLGATLVLVMIRDTQALIAHLGDSRVYLFRKGGLQPLTRDHSLVQELLERGVISAEDAQQAGPNGGPTRFLGMAVPVPADIQVMDLQSADKLLLCSDGLTCMLTDEALADIFRKGLTLEETANQFITSANEAGGDDNITALIIEMREEQKT